MSFPGGLSYPPTPREDVVELHHGIAVADPYRWLEDLEAPVVKTFVKRQNELTRAELATSRRAEFEARLRVLWNHERYGIPCKAGGRYFYTHNPGLQRQDALFWQPSYSAEPRLLLDPNLSTEEGGQALADYIVSPDGSKVAYALASAGSDWQEWRIREVDTGRDLPDRLRWIKFCKVAWTRDNSGFFYARYAAPDQGLELSSLNQNQRLYFHALGSGQDDDLLVLERPDQPRWGFQPILGDDAHHLFIEVWRGTDPETAYYLLELDEKPWRPRPLIEDFDARYVFVALDRGRAIFHTDLDAPLGRVISLELEAPARTGWREVLPERPEPLLEVTRVADRLVATRSRHAVASVALHRLDGSLVTDLELPATSSVQGFKAHPEDPETFFAHTTFTAPATIWRIDVREPHPRPFRAGRVESSSDRFKVEQVFYESKDKTVVPMFLVSARDRHAGKPGPVYLYGYGGFSVSMSPTFSPAILHWLELGGLFAQPCLRGGGEYGRTWHEAGTKLHKQNVFDDFLAAAEWLIAEGYTTPEQLAIGGASNGGLLIGACMTQRPDLFAACLPAVGVLDMVRFHRFTIGWAWQSDYGNPEDPEEFHALLAYSPYHNVKPGTRYPATLITTGDHDDRVFPAHSFKFAAALQAAQVPGGPPILLRVEQDAGHGAGTAVDKLIATTADRWAFMARHLGLEPQPTPGMPEPLSPQERP